MNTSLSLFLSICVWIYVLLERPRYLFFTTDTTGCCAAAHLMRLTVLSNSATNACLEGVMPSSESKMYVHIYTYPTFIPTQSRCYEYGVAS